jgi:hypothetical protein
VDELVGQELGSVVFVRDYVQLDFDGPRLSLYVWPTVVTDRRVDFGEPGYRDALCELIGRPVTGVAGPTLDFAGTRLLIDPAPDDVLGAEIALFQGETTELTVWRPGEPPFDGPDWR